MEVQLGITEKFETLRLNSYDSSPEMSVASTPTSTPTTPITGGYELVKVKKEDAGRAIDFLNRFFFRDEPLNVEKNLLETPEARCPELEEYSVKSIEEGCSLMAIDADGEIVGITVNGVQNKDDPEEEFDCPNPKFEKILTLLDTVDKQCDIFGQFPDIDKVLIVKILSVDSSWRGRGIAKALIDRTRELCKEENYPMIRVDCTSHFSAKATSRLGFQCIYTLKYADHCEDGKPVFVPEPPHNEVKVYVQRV